MMMISSELPWKVNRPYSQEGLGVTLLNHVDTHFLHLKNT